MKKIEKMARRNFTVADALDIICEEDGASETEGIDSSEEEEEYRDSKDPFEDE